MHQAKCCTIAFLIAAAFIYAAFPPPAPARLQPKNNVSSGNVNIDMFIGYWKESKPRKLYGSLDVWDILTRCTGDPLRPSKKGAVLTELNSVSYAKLDAGSSIHQTGPSGVQHVFYIASGWGTISSGRFAHSIRQGFGIIIPPGVEFKLTVGGEKPLTLYIIEEPVPAGFTTGSELVVKNDFSIPVSSNIRRADSRGWLLGRRDGLSSLTAMDPIVFVPRSLVPPHVHLPGDEEIWIALDEMNIQLGSEGRPLPEGAAYKVPADGRTPHVNINYSNREQRLLWLMCAPAARRQTAPSGETGGELSDPI